MGGGVYADDDNASQVIPKWRLVKKWAKGHGIYDHPDLDRNEWLYRYMRADQAFRMLRDRKLWFSAPDRWEDPHEAWWCDQLFRKGSHLATAFAYGSCWTRRWLDEPFWRMYACRCVEEETGAAAKKPQHPVRVLPAVRFRSKVGTLFEWLRQAAQQEQCKAFMGRVRYCPIAQLVDTASKMRRADDNPAPTAATGLHMKRRAYKFEDEVRLLWIDRKPKRDGHGIAFDPTALFDQVMIGPTKDESRYLEVESMLVDLGIPDTLIEPSSIWTPPDVHGGH
jgi:hypothetical protein